jgi:hypothetical protein
MPFATILFGIALSTLYGAAFHFLRGGSGRKLLVDLLLAWAGFWIGDQVGLYLGFTFWSVGVLNAGMGTLVSLALLLLGDLLGRIRWPGAREE